MPDLYCPAEQRERVALLLKQQSRSVAWLARQLGMNESQLHHTLHGRRRVPVGFWPRVAAALGVQLDDLLLEAPAA